MEQFIKSLKKYQNTMSKGEEDPKNKLGQAPASHETQRNFNNDLSITMGTIESLFTFSNTFSDAQIEFLLKSINRIIEEYLERLQNNKKTLNKTNLREDSCICMENLSSVWVANSSRIPLIMPFIKSAL
jgi:hypothetical protein